MYSVVQLVHATRLVLWRCRPNMMRIKWLNLRVLKTKVFQLPFPAWQVQANQNRNAMICLDPLSLPYVQTYSKPRPFLDFPNWPGWWISCFFSNLELAEVPISSRIPGLLSWSVSKPLPGIGDRNKTGCPSMIVFWLAVSLLCCHAPHLWMPIRYFGVDGKGRFPVGEKWHDTFIGYDSICPFIVRAQEVNATESGASEIELSPLKTSIPKGKQSSNHHVFPDVWYAICCFYFLCVWQCFLPKVPFPY